MGGAPEGLRTAEQHLGFLSAVITRPLGLELAHTRPKMSARIIYGNPEIRLNSRGENYTYTSFEIMSHDGSVKGEVGVPFGQPHVVLMETKWRLRDLLKDAVTDIDRGPLG